MQVPLSSLHASVSAGQIASRTSASGALHLAAPAPTSKFGGGWRLKASPRKPSGPGRIASWSSGVPSSAVTAEVTTITQLPPKSSSGGRMARARCRTRLGWSNRSSVMRMLVGCHVAAAEAHSK